MWSMCLIFTFPSRDALHGDLVRAYKISGDDLSRTSSLAILPITRVHMAVLPTDAIRDPSPQLQVVLRWLDALVTTHDVKALESTLTEDYTYQVLPRSLGRLARSKSEFLEYCDSFSMRVVRDFEATIHEVIETPNNVVFHASSTAISATGYPYANEYIIIMHVNLQPDGEYKIRSTKEFVDSKLSSEFFPAEAKRQQEVVEAKRQQEMVMTS
ncbi:hypothetical protein EUX98_g8547 [Antrodiella citrinella]|uniref:SnoaL-like domain-containing protein n=1 Tax=Antrodiella citrinella TaxID=2447956 RepID=A0A4S4MC54_9APHY|nr:hypothetical protein EUX98_g8547 [Antrodiella citrinella]